MLSLFKSAKYLEELVPLQYQTNEINAFTHKLWSTSAFPTAAWRRKYYSNWELTPSILHLAKWLISNSEPDDNQRKNIYIRMRQTKITLDGPQSLNTIHLKQYN